MPFINGRYYMNPFYGRALEAAREAEEQNRKRAEADKAADGNQQLSEAHEESTGAPDDFWADV